VNNAGILVAGDAWTHTDEEMESILDINIRGAMAGCRAATKGAVLSFTTSLEGEPPRVSCAPSSKGGQGSSCPRSATNLRPAKAVCLVIDQIRH